MKVLSFTTLRELARLSLPMVVSQGAFAVMVFTDRWFMAQIDSIHIAATLGGGVASMFCVSFFVGLISYGNALVAQYYGAGMMHKCPRVVSQGMLIAVAAIPPLVLVGLAMGNAFYYIGHDPAQVELEQAYFYTLMAGSFFLMVKACLASYFVGIGRTRVVMLVDVLGVIFNVPLSWLLIFGHYGFPEMGIVGAGVGTVVANLLTIFLLLFFYLSRAHRQQFSVDDSFSLDRGVMRRYVRLGTPSALEAFMNSASFNLYLLLFQAYGVVQGAAMAVVFNWDMMSFIPLTGLGIGVMSLIGRFVGAQDMQRTNQVISSGFILACGYSAVLVVLFLTFRMELIDVFATSDEYYPEVRELAAAMMIGLCTYMVTDAILLVSGGVLRGAGDTRWVMWTSTSLRWTMLVVQYLVIRVWELDALVSWWIFVGMLLTIAVCYVLRLAGGRWRRPERIARVMSEH